MGNWFDGWGFFPVLTCDVVAMEILLIFPVPDGYLILLIAHKPFKEKSKEHSGLVWACPKSTDLCCQSS